MSKKIPIFISTSTSPYRGNQGVYIRLLYQTLDRMNFERKTLGVTTFSHKKGFIDISRLIKQCFGTIIIGFPRDYISKKVIREGLDESEIVVKDTWVSTVWNDIEGAMAYQCGLPMLILRDKSIPNDDGVFDRRNLEELNQLQSIIHKEIDSNNPNELLNKKFDDIFYEFYKICQTYKYKHQEEIPVFLSVPSSNHRNQDLFLENIKNYLSKFKIILTNLETKRKNETGFKRIKNALEKSNGAMIIGFKHDHIINKISRLGVKNREINIDNLWESTIWNDIEGAMAYEADLPLIILKQTEIKRGNGIFDEANHEFKIIDFEPEEINELNLDQLDERNKPRLFKIIDQWILHVKNYRDYQRLGDKLLY